MPIKMLRVQNLAAQSNGNQDDKFQQENLIFWAILCSIVFALFGSFAIKTYFKSLEIIYTFMLSMLFLIYTIKNLSVYTNNLL